MTASIDLVPYDSRWPAAFEAEAGRLRAALGPLALRVDHNGSTAVPGLAAKPVIDIQVSVSSLQPLAPYVDRLASLGYIHVPHADDAFCPFFHRPAGWPHTHHVHLVHAGSEEERRTIAFRDYLREHADARREYETLKRKLAAAFAGDSAESREAYAIAKTEFVERAITAASAADTYVTADDGVRLFVQTMGDGPQVVLIPNGYYLLDALARFAGGRTLAFVDPRNRGRSDAVSDRSKLERGIHHDVADFEAIRRHFGAERVDLIGHSYMGVTVALFAMTHPDRTGRVVQIGAMAADPSKAYAAHLTNTDGTLRDVFGRIGELQKERPSIDGMTFCRKFWAILRELYVLHPSDADRLGWEPCHLPNESGFMKQYTDYVLPSIQALNLTDADYARATAPILAIHGRQDRSSPYGGGREWALRLPNARLITVDGAAHVPWIENPDTVLGGIGTFLDGAWPAGAERVESLE